MEGKKEREMRGLQYISLWSYRPYSIYFFFLLCFIKKNLSKNTEVKSDIESCFWIIICDVWVWVWSVCAHRKYFIFCVTTQTRGSEAASFLLETQPINWECNHEYLGQQFPLAFWYSSSVSFSNLIEQYPCWLTFNLASEDAVFH